MNTTTLKRITLIPMLFTLFMNVVMASTLSQPNVLWHNSTTGAIKFMPVNGMTPENTLSVVDSSNTNLLPKGMGDFTGDGQPDILFHNQNSGNLRIWEMDGTAKVENIQVLGSSNTNLKIAGVGDFDGDGDNDIATFNTNSGALRMWVMDGTTRVENILVLSGANTNLVPRGAGDMDGDGIPDIVLRNNNSGTVRVWTMNSDLSRKGNVSVTGSSNTNLELRGVTDINGDGNNDILNYNIATGKLRAWLMDGSLGIIENAEVTQDTDLEWSVRGGYFYWNSDNNVIVTLKENDFWVYKWQETWTNTAQGSSPSVENKHGEFRIILGDATLMNGEEAFPIAIEGDSGGYAPRWKYLAIADDNSLLGSTGGEFQIIYSATETQWEGGGFLISFNDSDEIKVQTSTYEGVYNTLDAIRVSHVDSSGGCEYVLSYQFCSENSVTARVNEHYKKGLGTVGSYEYYYYSYSSGGFTTTHKKEASVELIDSSLNALDGTKLNKPTWEEVATLPNTVTFQSTAILDNKIYISGRGLGYIQVFNITTNSFEENIILPDSIYDYNLQVLDGYLYIMNKENGIIKLIDTEHYTVEYVNSFGSYTVLTNWDYLNTDNNTTSNYTIAMSPSVLSYTASIYLFDPYSNQWFTFNEPLSNYNKWIGFKIIEVGNILYFIGGTYISNSTWNTRSTYEDIKRFDLSTGLWLSNAAKMNTIRERNFALVKYNGKLIVFGGSDGTKSVATVEEYDPDIDSWKNLEALPEPLSGIQAVATENKVYVITATKILSFEP